MVKSIFILLLMLSLQLVPAEIISYEDGTPEDSCSPGVAGWEFAEWFTPPSYPCSLVAVMFFPYNGALLHWKVWDDDGEDPGPPQDPGTVLRSGNIYPGTTLDWTTIALSPAVVITSGDFYIGWEEHSPPYWNGFDMTAPHSNRAVMHWEIMAGIWLWSFLSDPLLGIDGDILIRAVVGSELEVMEPASRPEAITMSAYPNPFNCSCAITVNVWAPLAAPAIIEIYDLRGKRICTHDAGSRHSCEQAQSGEALLGNASPLQAGAQTFIWQPDKSITSGIYLVRARTEDGKEMTKKTILIR